MNKPVTKNVAASVRDRLLARAREQKEDFQYLLIRYANERFLYRLGNSTHRDRFVLKGATLFTLWAGEPHRPTKDLDFLSFGNNSVDEAVATFREICAVPVEDDGFSFPSELVTGEERREDEEYPGLRMHVTARLGSARIPLLIDLGFGDAVTPNPLEDELPTLLAFPKPRLRVYPRETVVAEKLEAAVRLGIANSRMKDFYDLQYLASNFPFEGSALVDAIVATFRRRGTALPMGIPLAISDEFTTDVGKQTQWNTFLRKSKLGRAELQDVGVELRRFLLPPLEAARERRLFTATWHPTGPWGSTE